MKPNVLTVGWLGEVNRPELWNPQAPKSYTKPETIEAWIADARAFQALAPFVGRVSSVVLLDSEGDVMESSDCRDSVELAMVITALCTHLEDDPEAFVVGLNVRAIFRSLAAMGWAENIMTPPWFWHETPNLIDMYDDLVPSRDQSKGKSDIPADLKNGFGLDSLLEYFHGHPALDKPDVTSNPTNALQMAKTAYALASVTGLV